LNYIILGSHDGNWIPSIGSRHTLLLLLLLLLLHIVFWIWFITCCNFFLCFQNWNFSINYWSDYSYQIILSTFLFKENKTGNWSGDHFFSPTKPNQLEILNFTCLPPLWFTIIKIHSNHNFLLLSQNHETSFLLIQ